MLYVVERLLNSHFERGEESMKTIFSLSNLWLGGLVFLALCGVGSATMGERALAQDGLIPAFSVEKSDIQLEQLAQPYTPFDKVGRKFAILGYESGTFEAWAYPLKILRNFEFSFLLGSSTRPIKAAEIVRFVSIAPEATTLTYVYQSFTVRAIYITPVNEQGAIILLDVKTTEPLTIVCGFLPVLQPMWPAGIGGQYAYWNDELKAYVISEPTGSNHGIVGSPSATGISYTPAHMFSDVPMEFKIEIKNPVDVLGKYIPIYLAGGKGKWESVKDVYQRLGVDPRRYYLDNAAHYRKLRESTLEIETPNSELNLAFEWAKVAYDNLVVDNPDLGKGLVAGLGASGTSGRPGFGWFFGGDAFINSLSIDSYCGYQTARDALAFTQKWQRKDGKMAHELSQAAGYVDWFGKYHYGYIHGDTTPFYIVAMYDYFRSTGDREFVQLSWESLKRAYDWCVSTDANGDGLMDNSKAGLGALEYGSLTGIESDIYLSAVWVRAAYAMQQLAQSVGDVLCAKKAAIDFERAQIAFREKFWDEKDQCYSYAFNSKGDLVREITPWMTVGLMWDLGDPERSVKSLERLSSSELTTDWGVRSLSNKSKYYEPLNYNYGAVWPFINSWVATAQYKHHLVLQGYSTLMASVRHTFDNQLGTLTEVFSGATNIWLAEAVPHQGFSSAGVVLPVVRGLLGLDGDAVKRSITFAPQFPADWHHVLLDNYRIGESEFAFDYQRNNSKVVIKLMCKNAAGYRVTIAPALGIGTRISHIFVDGKLTTFDTLLYSQVAQPVITAAIEGKEMTFEIDFEPAVELLPPLTDTRTGDANKGLKVISVKHVGKKLLVQVEGISGEAYVVDVTNADRIAGVEGARLDGSRLFIEIPVRKPGEFLGHEFTIAMR